MNAPTSSLLPLSGIHNIRDLGGQPQRNGGRTLSGRLFRGCGMSGLTDEGKAALVGRGFDRVIDLRSARETAAEPGPFHDRPELRRIALFDGLEPVTRMLDAAPDADLSRRYIAALEQRPGLFARVFDTIAEADKGPVLFHCTAGKDRTGLVAALLLALAEVPPEAIAADYAATGTLGAPLLQRLRAQALAQGDDPGVVDRVLRADAETLDRVLTWLEAHFGGPKAYLLAAGTAEAALDRIRTRLCGPAAAD